MDEFIAITSGTGLLRMCRIKEPSEARESSTCCIDVCVAHCVVEAATSEGERGQH